MVGERGYAVIRDLAPYDEQGFRMGRPVGLLACSLLLSGCAHPKITAAPMPACSPVERTDSTWRRVQTPAFSFEVPEPFEYRKARRLEGFIEQYRGRAIFVTYELSTYTGPALSDLPGTIGYTECTTEIGGRRVQLASYWNARTGGYVLHAFWPSVLPPNSFGEIGLALTATTWRPEARADLLSIVRSGRFEP